MLNILGVMLVGWTTEVWHGVSMEAIAMAGALALVLPRVGSLSFGEGWRTIHWDIVVLFGGSMALAQILLQEGLVNRLSQLLFQPLPSEPVILLLLCLTPLLILIRLGFANVIGMLAMVLPAVLVAAAGWGVDPLWIGLYTYPVMAPGMLLPTQSPASMISYAWATFTPQEYRLADVGATLLLVICFLLAAFVYWPVFGSRLSLTR